MTAIRTAPPRPTLVLAVLFAGAFVMGCAEMLAVGLIDKQNVVGKRRPDSRVTAVGELRHVLRCFA